MLMLQILLQLYCQETDSQAILAAAMEFIQ